MVLKYNWNELNIMQIVFIIYANEEAKYSHIVTVPSFVFKQVFQTSCLLNADGMIFKIKYWKT